MFWRIRSSTSYVTIEKLLYNFQVCNLLFEGGQNLFKKFAFLCDDRTEIVKINGLKLTMVTYNYKLQL